MHVYEMIDVIDHAPPTVAARLKIACGRVFTSKTRKLLIDSFGLTDAEADLLIELCRGAPIKEIARKLQKSVGTVRVQKQRVFIKMHVASTAQLVSVAFLNIVGAGYVDMDTDCCMGG